VSPRRPAACAGIISICSVPCGRQEHCSPSTAARPPAGAASTVASARVRSGIRLREDGVDASSTRAEAGRGERRSASSGPRAAAKQQRGTQQQRQRRRAQRHPAVQRCARERKIFVKPDVGDQQQHEDEDDRAEHVLARRCSVQRVGHVGLRRRSARPRAPGLFQVDATLLQPGGDIGTREMAFTCSRCGALITPSCRHCSVLTRVACALCTKPAKLRHTAIRRSSNGRRFHGCPCRVEAGWLLCDGMGISPTPSPTS